MKKLLFAAILLLVVSAGNAYPNGPVHGMTPGMPAGGPGMMESSLVAALDWLDLSATQKGKMTELFKARIADMDKAEQGAEARFKRMEALREAAEKGDVETVRALMREEGAEREERMLQGVRFVASFRSVLTDAQRARVDDVRARFKARMQPGGEPERGAMQKGPGMHAPAPEAMGDGPGHAGGNAGMPPKAQGRHGKPYGGPAPADLKQMLERWIHENA
ncbi:Spy/CpxP family protein refolding chaperone [Desulfovibrio psychrotolerans]|uniref:Periplasmic heavy metal sensor n=1 Tax=Desulfovibrio psychrotolerans TaxID=415242 RepID=A0A7J0BQ83_9BACT|nr:Spy/CpxP family protein refolding chaperone [Desulfovibrio psychrotolerans]GFM35867.1 hypothetical protein DSM19430T_05510 [Desulfovibrio psychrotolerans]